MESFLTMLLGVGAGAAGYLIVTFWFQPILRYREIKFRAATDLVFYANAIQVKNKNNEICHHAMDRKFANRRCAADLAAIYPELPFPYRCYLKCRSEDPVGASENLIRLSNTSTWEDMDGTNATIDAVRTSLRLSVKSA